MRRRICDFSKKVGVLLREARIASGVTRDDMAEKLGVSHQQVQKYECGHNHINISTLEDFCNIIGIDSCDIIIQARKPKSKQNIENMRLHLDIAKHLKKIKNIKLKIGLNSAIKDIATICDSIDIAK